MKSPWKLIVGLSILCCINTLFQSCGKDAELQAYEIINETNADEPLDGTTENNDFVVRTVVFSPIEDAHVQDKTGYNQYILRLEENRRLSYLMFDLSAVNGAITDAVLQFTVDSDEGDGIIEIHRGQESTWTENTITSANAPQIGDPLGSVASHFKMKDTQKVPLDKTKVFPELTSLVLSHKGENDLAIASKEHQGKIGPKLIVTLNQKQILYQKNQFLPLKKVFT